VVLNEFNAESSPINGKDALLDGAACYPKGEATTQTGKQAKEKMP